MPCTPPWTMSQPWVHQAAAPDVAGTGSSTPSPANQGRLQTTSSNTTTQTLFIEDDSSDDNDDDREDDERVKKSLVDDEGQQGGDDDSNPSSRPPRIPEPSRSPPPPPLPRRNPAQQVQIHEGNRLVFGLAYCFFLLLVTDAPQSRSSRVLVSFVAQPVPRSGSRLSYACQRLLVPSDPRPPDWAAFEEARGRVGLPTARCSKWLALVSCNHPPLAVVERGPQRWVSGFGLRSC